MNRKHFNEQYERTYDGAGDFRFYFYSSATLRWFKKEFLALQPKTMVDLGAGDVWVLRNLSEVSAATTITFALDMSDASCHRAQMRLKEFPRNTQAKMQILQGDVCSLPFRAESLNFVMSTMVLEHVDDVRFISEIRRVLTYSGIALITTVIKRPWAWYYLKDTQGKSILELSHLREYSSLEEIEKLFKTQGFEILLSSSATIKFSLLTPVLRLLLKLFQNQWIFKFPATPLGIFLRLITRIPIPGYESAELVVLKQLPDATTRL